MAKNGKIIHKKGMFKMTMVEINEQLTRSMENFLINADKRLRGNQAAGARARKLSMEIEKLLKLWREMSTWRVVE